MPRTCARLVFAAGLVGLVPVSIGAGDSTRVDLAPAPEIVLPGDIDSNSPAFWDEDRLYVITSLYHPYVSTGEDIDSLQDPVAVYFPDRKMAPRWIEAVVRDDDGTLYGYYHQEPPGICPGVLKTAPAIGALRSRDLGATWEDLGLILTAPPGSADCDSANPYFVGGVGDFSAMLDADRRYLYFFFTSYTSDVDQQGVGIARMPWDQRDAPVGEVVKWNAGHWTASGRGGPMTPVFPVNASWHSYEGDAFWGPSVHWNTHLERYVMLLSRASPTGADWANEGVYISFARRLDPRSWSKPRKIVDGGAWYPQVMGIEPGEGTDKRAGRIARFFMAGVSQHYIVFEKP